MKKIYCIIPARYHSTRLPGKPLADIAGKPMIQRVYEQAKQAKAPFKVLVATDHEDIAAVVRNFGGEVILTSPNHPTGTDRLAEVAKNLPDAEIIINIQGDEPQIDPHIIDLLAKPFAEEMPPDMVTLMTPMSAKEENQPSCVKVVTDLKGNALYFSRSLIPFLRGGDRLLPVYKHIGLYGYRREFLLHYATLEPTPLERMESLEQLRALEHGFTIRTLLTDHQGIGVDTPEDLIEINRVFINKEES